ncbi:SGNH/GDSL hydrolase family protein [Flavobacteriaceae bacterium]|jgi:acyl-CoA thioesterase-1|nr:SGNH/GDSL hydrolase family protein [Flavobacteriaceae bacterium]MDC1539992.1 SGNH/GDSL hydrolase family protein [Flavobacteriaceae bacterium]
MRLKIATLNLIAGCLLVGCNLKTDQTTFSNTDPEDTTTEESTTSKKFNLIALGDSYTIGQSVCETCRFPAQLKDSLQTYYTALDTFNLQIIARTGWTTSNLKNAIASEEPQTDFDLVTLLIGVNNQYQNKPFSLYETEFIELITTAISLVDNKASKLIVVSIPDYAYTPFGQGSNPENISAQLELYNSYAQTYCKNNDLKYVNITDITQEGLTNPQLVASDNLHPSELAYTKFVERILPLALDILE